MNRKIGKPRELAAPYGEVQVECYSLITTEQDAFSDVSMAKIDSGGVEIYPAVCKTISLSLSELIALVEEIEAQGAKL